MVCTYGSAQLQSVERYPSVHCGQEFIMRFIRLVGLVSLLCLGLVAVHSMGGKDPGAGGGAGNKPLVAVSILPQAYFVQRLAGDRMEVLTLVGPGQSPHSYEPTPRQMADLSGAQAWFTVGGDFEAALLPKIASLYPRLQLVDTTRGIQYRSIEAHGHDDEDADHAGEEDNHDEAEDQDEADDRDPHVWLGHNSVKVQLGHILDGLVNLDPDGASVYKANHAAFVAEIDALFQDLSLDLAALRGKPVFVFHPAFGYFLDEFGILQEAVETGGKEPTQKALAALIDKAREEGATAIFVQAQFPAAAARSVAAAIGGAVVEIDPLALDWLDNLNRIAEALRRAAP
jgi:zinc transport system substrate-binding protein